VNVFELGHTYLQLVQTLNLRLPLVDPSHYISRFSALLEFGDETHKVAHDAVRLVQRFDRDWMTKGRRPAGICGAALLLAARMNNFRRSVEEVVQVVKIADSTLKKRLEEFARTSSAGLTVGDFRRVWLEEEMDPPAFSKGKEREREDEDDCGDYGEDKDDESAIRGKKKRKGQANKRKRNQRGEEDEDRDEWEAGRDGPSQAAPASSSRPRPAIDPALLYEGILAGTMGPPPHHTADPSNMNIDPSLLPPPRPPPSQASEQLTAPTALDETAHTILTEEVSRFLSHSQGAQLSEALAEVEARRQVGVVDELMGLNEEELDRLLLSEDEVRVKERVWVEMNKEYLEALAGEWGKTGRSDVVLSLRTAKAEREESGVQPVKSKKVRHITRGNRSSSSQFPKNRSAGKQAQSRETPPQHTAVQRPNPCGSY
jgi:transcription factor IIIB 90 kDa subunit